MDQIRVEIYVEIKRETDGAVLCSDGVSSFWLPRSQVGLRHVKGNDYAVDMPEWLAIKKGVV